MSEASLSDQASTDQGRCEASHQSQCTDLVAGNLIFRSQCKRIEQQLPSLNRPSSRVSRVSPYILHRRRVQLERLVPFRICSRSRNLEELRHPRDGAASIYGRHRIAAIDFNFVSVHLVHSDLEPSVPARLCACPNPPLPRALSLARSGS